MAAPCILMVGDDGVLWIPSRPHASDPSGLPLFVRGHDDHAARRLFDYVSRRKTAPEILILADTMAQDFERVTLPPVGLWDKRRLIARRKKMSSPSIAQRGGDGFLLAHLPANSPVWTWRARVIEAQCLYRGAALLPVESAALLPALIPAARRGWALCISLQRGGGVRQIATYNGQLMLTRMTPPLAHDAGTPAFTAASLMLDIEASRQYLRRFGLPAAGSQDNLMTLGALLPEHLHDAFVAAAPEGTRAVCWTPSEAARGLRLPFAPGWEDPMGDLVHAAFAIRAGHVPQRLWTDDDRARARQRLIRRGLQIAGAGLFALGLASCGIQIASTARQWAQYQHTRHILSERQQTLDALQASYAPLAATHDQWQKAARRAVFFDRADPYPLGILRALRAVLPENLRPKGIEITRKDDAILIALDLPRADSAGAVVTADTFQSLHPLYPVAIQALDPETQRILVSVKYSAPAERSAAP